MNYSTIYCLATGKPIAEIADDELGLIIEAFADLPVDEREAALIRLALGSMRPSLPWMSITPTRLDTLRRIAPKELLAYLLNRMYAPIERPTATKGVSADQYFEAKRARIQMWKLIESMQFQPDQLEQLLLILLELDSTFNLSTMIKPAYVPSVWLIQDQVGLTAFIESLLDWRNNLMEKKLKDERQARMSREYWSQGNRLTGKALFNSFMETKPLSKSGEKKAKKKAEQDMFDSILAGMFANEKPIGLQESVPSMPAQAKTAAFAAALAVSQPRNLIKPAGKPMRFGVKSNG